MKTRTRFRTEDVTRIAHELDEAPSFKPDEMTTAKAIQALAPKLRALRAKGYTLEAIATMLSQKGLTIATGTLRATLRRAVNSGGRAKARPTKTPAREP